MPSTRQDDRAWTEAVDRYVATAKRARRRALGPGTLRARERGGARARRVAVRGGRDRRRPARGQAQPGQRVRQPRDRDDLLVEDLRDPPVQHPRRQRRRGDLRLPLERRAARRASGPTTSQQGRAFEFETDGDEAGRIETKSDTGRPFTTNATGVATGLNADRVDGLHAAKIDFRAPINTPSTQVLDLGGLVLSATCARGPGPRRARHLDGRARDAARVVEQGPGQRAVLPAGQRPQPGRELLAAGPERRRLAGHARVHDARRA